MGKPAPPSGHAPIFLGEVNCPHPGEGYAELFKVYGHPQLGIAVAPTPALLVVVGKERAERMCDAIAAILIPELPSAGTRLDA
jgi:hypothetical protein